MDSKNDYKYLEHTADVKFIAYGDSLEEAFSNAAKAAIGVMVKPEMIKKKERREFEIRSGKPESLMYDFLEEILFFLDTDGILLPHAEHLKISKTDKGLELKATMSGDFAKDYDFSGDIKSVTYSQMQIKKAERFEITVVLDI